MDPLRITVTESASIDVPRPVSGGVPLAAGAGPAGCRFSLRDGAGRPVPLQSEVLARWKDGSARWVLLDFMAAVDAGETAEYSLEWASGEDPGAKRSPEGREAAPELLSPFAPAGDRGLLAIDGRLVIDLVLTDGHGNACRAVVEEWVVETAGPVRGTLAVRGAFRDPSGARVFQFRLRVSHYAEGRRIRIEPLILLDAERGVLQTVCSLRLVLRSQQPALRGRIGGVPGWEGPANHAVRLLQVDDQNCRLEGATGKGDQAPGWAEITDSEGTMAVALREFWQQWPKSIEFDDGELAVGLLPAFAEGDFAHMTPWYKHQYLFAEKTYRLRTGQARKWDLWIDLDGHGDRLARMAGTPLIPAADPHQAIAAGVWQALTPAGVPEMSAYDPWAEALFEAYCASIRGQRDYGAMNWGDWFGERQVNWGNHEYDTVNQLLIQFARTGDPKYFLAADAAARHSTEVDVVHAINDDLAAHFTDNWSCTGYPPRPGMVHEHSLGHVGSFYPVETIRKLFVAHGIGSSDRPYLCLDPFNLGHIWTQGMVRYYFLTGDPFVKETVETIGDNLARLVEDGEYRFGIDDPHFGRAAGWPLLALAGAYELSFEERFLGAMKNLVDRALERQDPNCGGWLYSLYPGHCHCTTMQHVGMAGFITSILINGLSRYWELTGDPRIPQAVDRALTFLNNDTWVDHKAGWRYTSCPASAFAGQPGVTIMAHVNGIRLNHNPEHARVLRKAWNARFEQLLEEPLPPGPGQGKNYTATVYGCAEASGILARQ